MNHDWSGKKSAQAQSFRAGRDERPWDRVGGLPMGRLDLAAMHARGALASASWA